MLGIVRRSPGDAMPRFHFHVIGKTVETDEVGTELPSAQYAKREGARSVGTLLAEGILARHGGMVRLEVTDETGLILFHLDVTSWDAPAMRAA